MIWFRTTLINLIKVSLIGLVIYFLLPMPFVLRLLHESEPVERGGERYFLVRNDSMKPEIEFNQLVLIDKTPFADLEVGDVIAFRATMDKTPIIMVHRIARIEDEGVHTKGDTFIVEDALVTTSENYLGVVRMPSDQIVDIWVNYRNPAYTTVRIMLPMAVFSLVQVIDAILSLKLFFRENLRRKIRDRKVIDVKYVVIEDHGHHGKKHH